MRRRRLSAEDIGLDTVVHIVMLVMLVAVIYPFYYVVVLSLNEGYDTSRGGLYFWPRKFTLQNYARLFSDPIWVNGLLISVLRTVTGTVGTLFLTGLVAYGLSFKELALKRVYFAILIVASYFHGGLIPYYVLLRQLHLLDTFLVYIVPSLLNTFFVIIMIAFFRDIPGEIHDAAHTDGANELQTYFLIIVPISKPMFATVALFASVEHWNAWFDAAYFVQQRTLKTLSFLMMELINRNAAFQMSQSDLSSAAMSAQTVIVTPQALQYAAMIVAILPILFVYPFLQKYFVKGMMLGSVKG